MSEWDYYIDYIEAEGLTQEEFSFEEWSEMVDAREEDRMMEMAREAAYTNFPYHY